MAIDGRAIAEVRLRPDPDAPIDTDGPDREGAERA
jgi:hypothetical protein